MLARPSFRGTSGGAARKARGATGAGGGPHWTRTSQECVRQMVIIQKTSRLASRARVMLKVKPLPWASDEKNGSNTSCLRRFDSGV
jgi:hypothetical protein